MSSIVENLKKGKNLSFNESKLLFNELMDGKYDESSIIEILEAFKEKGKQKMNWPGVFLSLEIKQIKLKQIKTLLILVERGRRAKLFEHFYSRSNYFGKYGCRSC